ncbi:MAG: hypothetical protein UT16_C0031G0002 [Candidatus Azambacteria bacterium GW2011_GWA2_39_10]|uniref:Uncharacterized protein n=1 Tax=Candidatus Azambacteria bacterium GW2011_GWA2_39_10 TaxID=1618611 RepID=A0A0G0PN60_9BACT|nr:MAG: hypothetical protein UT16_C0031G0002 [Candidatus Azambacteria bacterium GW2011_GWA2_39_10]
MKTILIDAVDAFVVETEGTFKIFEEMHDLLETFSNTSHTTRKCLSILA